MEFREFGESRCRISAMGLGCSRIGAGVFYDNRRQSEAVLEKAFERGINYFDTAAHYGYGSSERAIGKVFRSRRDQVLIGTKGGFELTQFAQYAQYLLPVSSLLRRSLGSFHSQIKKASRKRFNFNVKNLRESLERSLQNLKTDYVDIYFLHNAPPDIFKSDQIRHFLDDLKKEGKILYAGISAASISDAVEAARYPEYEVLQIEFNILSREAKTGLFPKIEKGKQGIIVKMPLARGILTPHHQVRTGTAPEIQNNILRLKRQEASGSLIKETGCSSTTAASLRYVLDHPEVSSVLTGTTNIGHLKENLSALSYPSFDSAVIKKFESLCL